MWSTLRFALRFAGLQAWGASCERLSLRGWEGRSVSGEGYVPAAGDGEFRPRLERGLAKKGYRAVWRLDRFDGDMPLARLALTVLDERYLRVRSSAITFRPERRSESDIAEVICEGLVVGGGRYAGEPIRYGSD